MSVCVFILVLVSTAVLASEAGSELPQFVDTAVVGIKLNDPDSAKQILPKKGLHKNKGAFPEYVVLNANRSERLSLRQHPNSRAYSFAEFVIEANSLKKPQSTTMGEVSQFITAKRIRLGLKLNEVLRLLGKPNQRLESEKETNLEYYLLDPDHPFLKKHNVPQYSGRYRFDKSKLLTRIEFGLSYP